MKYIFILIFISTVSSLFCFDLGQYYLYDSNGLSSVLITEDAIINLDNDIIQYYTKSKDILTIHKNNVSKDIQIHDYLDKGYFYITITDSDKKPIYDSMKLANSTSLEMAKTISIIESPLGVYIKK